jgi:hypothetical protein
LQISGARWKPEHVPKVLAHRCAYLNNQLWFFSLEGDTHPPITFTN